jgi:hypothetical protein
VSRGSVVDETKDRKSHEALPIEGSARNEDLRIVRRYRMEPSKGG